MINNITNIKEEKSEMMGKLIEAKAELQVMENRFQQQENTHE